MKNIFITGGGGYIGTNLTEKLLKIGVLKFLQKNR